MHAHLSYWSHFYMDFKYRGKICGSTWQWTLDCLSVAQCRLIRGPEFIFKQSSIVVIGWSGEVYRIVESYSAKDHSTKPADSWFCDSPSKLVEDTFLSIATHHLECTLSLEMWPYPSWRRNRHRRCLRPESYGANRDTLQSRISKLVFSRLEIIFTHTVELKIQWHWAVTLVQQIMFGAPSPQILVEPFLQITKEILFTDSTNPKWSQQLRSNQV